jgi:hypothetical protein
MNIHKYVFPILILIIAATGIPNAAILQLPRTGQTASYAAGDDGSYQKGVEWPLQRFWDHGDGTVTDNLTNLMWTRDAGTTNIAGCPAWVLMDWNHALVFIECLNDNNYLGHSDWRLPNRKELRSLIDYGQSSPALQYNHPFDNVQLNWYWTSTTYAGNTAEAWTVNFNTGEVFTAAKSGSSYVWAVRDAVTIPSGTFSITGKVTDSFTGNPLASVPVSLSVGTSTTTDATGDYTFTGLASTSYTIKITTSGYEVYTKSISLTQNTSLNISLHPITVIPRTGQTANYAAGDDGSYQKGVEWPLQRFWDHGDGTVTDNLTNLMWTRDAGTTNIAGCPAWVLMDWNHALVFIECLNDNNYLGHSDWRLPNRKELRSLIDYGQSSPALQYNHPFDNVQLNWYWTSTTYAGNTAEAWTVNFNTGEVFTAAKSGSSYVWAVRDAVTIPSGTFSITGKVTDSFTGNPLASVPVSLSVGTSTTTDATGDYTFTGLASTSYTIKITTSGYEVYTKSISLTQNTSLNISLHPITVIPRTGQTANYAAGDDGSYQKGVEWPLQRFWDHGDGSVTDNLTNLIWTKDAGMTTIAGCVGGLKNWDDALLYAACLNTNSYLGYTDWRLPNRKELRSLIDYGQSSPVLPYNHPFDNVQLNWYWTSTTYAGNTAEAWAVNLNTGEVFATEKGDNYVWAVRDAGTIPSGTFSITGKVTDSFTGNQLTDIPVSLSDGTSTMTDANGDYTFTGLASTLYTIKITSSGYEVYTKSLSLTQNATLNISLHPITVLPRTGQTTSYAAGDDGSLQNGVEWPLQRFWDHGDGSVTDNLTSLMWTKDAGTTVIAGCGGGLKNWYDAIAYAACLNTNSYLGYTDWRLPNRKELRSLIDYGQASPALPYNHPFDNAQLDWYWTSTTYAGNTAEAWAVNLNTGEVFATEKGDNYVWAVRGGVGKDKPCLSDVVINSNVLYTSSTTVTLSLACGEENKGWLMMQFSNDGINWSTPEPFRTSKSWTLSSGDGIKTVYVKFRDAAGILSEIISDTIVFTSAPSDIVNCEWSAQGYFCRIKVAYQSTPITVVFKFKAGKNVYIDDSHNPNIYYPNIENIEAVSFEGIDIDTLLVNLKTELINNFGATQQEAQVGIQKAREDIIVGAFLEWYFYKKYGPQLELSSNLSDSVPHLNIGTTHLTEIAMLKGEFIDSEKSMQGFDFITDNFMSEEFYRSMQYGGDLRGFAEAARNNLLIPIAQKFGRKYYTPDNLYVEVERSNKFFDQVESIKAASEGLLDSAEMMLFFFEIESHSNAIQNRLNLLSNVFSHDRNKMYNHANATNTLSNDFINKAFVNKSASFIADKLKDKVAEAAKKELLSQVINAVSQSSQASMWGAMIFFDIGIAPGLEFNKIYSAMCDVAYLGNLYHAIDNFIDTKYDQWKVTPPTIGDIDDVGELLKMREFIKLTAYEKGNDIMQSLVTNILMGISSLGNSNNWETFEQSKNQIKVGLDSIENDYNRLTSPNFGIDLSKYGTILNKDIQMEVVETDPDDSSVSINNAPHIRVVYSKDIDQTTIKNKVIVLNPQHLEVDTYSYGLGDTVYLHPKSLLSNGITYEIVVYSGIEDLYGNTVDNRGIASYFTVGLPADGLTAGLDVNVTTGSAPFEVKFIPSAQNGSLYVYHYDFGDSSPTHGSYIADYVYHTYQNPGTYIARLTVRDDITGATAVAERTITVTQNQYNLTVSLLGTGSGTVSATGLTCSGYECTGTYNSGFEITLTATPDAGSTFTSWIGCDSVNDNQCILNMNRDKTVTAIFTVSCRDTDLDGYYLEGGVCGPVDCNDGNPLEHPGQTWYKDADNDGYSDGSTQTACARPSGYKISSELSDTSGDCDDNDISINPLTKWYQDNDRDGYGNQAIYVRQCTQPEGSPQYVLNNIDYNDSNPNIGPLVKLGSSNNYYLSLQDAYDDASDGDIIRAVAVTITEDLYLDQDKSVTLEGGYNGDFTSQSGKTTIQGNITVTKGVFTLGDVIM